eukprot:SM000044S15979  [mRNA]  locus=s44:365527:369937:- [translate_table: standard]
MAGWPPRWRHLVTALRSRASVGPSVWSDGVAGLQSAAQSYCSDWRSGLRLPVVLAAVPLVLAQSVVHALVFGVALLHKTQHAIGPAETLFSTFLCGAIFSLLAKQPNIIVGVSGPVVIFIYAVFDTATRIQVEFLPWLGWIGVWCSFLLTLLSLCRAGQLKGCITAFSWEILRITTGLYFIYDAVAFLIWFVERYPPDSAYLALWLATTTFVVSMALSRAYYWPYLSAEVRRTICDLGPLLALIFLTGVAGMPRETSLRLFPRVESVNSVTTDVATIPYHSDHISKMGSISRLLQIPLWAGILALVPGMLMASLIFYEQSCVSLLAQEPTVKRVGVDNWDWDLLVFALLVLFCSLLGLPFACGLWYQSARHVDLLRAYEKLEVEDMESQEVGRHSIHERQRLSAFLIADGAGLLLLPGFITLPRLPPQAVLVGLLLQAILSMILHVPSQTGFSHICDLPFISRLHILLQEQGWREPLMGPHGMVIGRHHMTNYMAIQAACALLMLGVAFSPLGLAYPAVLLLALFLRQALLDKAFSYEMLSSLDVELWQGRDALHSLIGRTEGGQKHLNTINSDLLSQPTEAAMQRLVDNVLLSTPSTLAPARRKVSAAKVKASTTRVLSTGGDDLSSSQSAFSVRRRWRLEALRARPDHRKLPFKRPKTAAAWKRKRRQRLRPWLRMPDSPGLVEEENTAVRKEAAPSAAPLPTIPQKPFSQTVERILGKGYRLPTPHHNVPHWCPPEVVRQDAAGHLDSSYGSEDTNVGHRDKFEGPVEAEDEGARIWQALLQPGIFSSSEPSNSDQQPELPAKPVPQPLKTSNREQVQLGQG